MPGVPVTFTVSSGGGTIIGDYATTDASGVATVGFWILGTVAGSNSLTASISGLAPVTFIATGTTCAAQGSAITCVLLPTLGGSFSFALAVNDGPVVVGSSTDNMDEDSFAVRWTRTSSGTWSITKITNDPNSYAVAINVNGTAVGVRGAGTPGRRVTLWPAAGGEIDLGPGDPTGINSAETVTGFRLLDPFSVFSSRAVVWRKPTAGWNLSSVNPSQDLPPLPGGTGVTSAEAINDAGVIAGYAAVSTTISQRYAVRWDPAGDQWAQPMALPGTDAHRSTSAIAINDNSQADIAGRVVKCSGCSGYGMLWPSGSSGTSLEPFGGGGIVLGMNNAQRVVGYGQSQSPQSEAFVWWPGLTSVEALGGLDGYTATQAEDINNLTPALAVGYGWNITSGSFAAIVWTMP